MNKQSDNGDFFDIIAEAIQASDNDPDLLVVGPSQEHELLKDTNFRCKPLIDGRIGAVFGLDVYARPDVEYAYIMDTTADGWPKPPDHRDD